MAGVIDGLDVVTFGAGGFLCALAAGHVVFMRDEADPSQDIVPIERLLGVERRSGARRKWLRLTGGAGMVEVDGPVDLLRLASTTIFPLPMAVAARMTLKGIRGLAMIDSGLVLLINPAMLD